MNIKKIEDYQLQELQEEKLYINKYDLSVIYLYELNRYWKEFLFDLIVEIANNNEILLYKTSLEDLKKQYKNLIKQYKLKIDKRDYIELTDYISLKDWQKDVNNGIGYFPDGVYLIQK